MNFCFVGFASLSGLVVFFFFKQKTAYEMRISDWSSDVCSPDQLATMRSGSVIVDMAAESGGNVEGSVSGEAKRIHGVTVIGAKNIAALMPADTSALFSRNLFNFLSAFWDKEAGKPVLDAIGRASCRERVCQYV